MTKRNFFGEVIHTPEDEPADFALFAAENDLGKPFGAVISDDGDGFQWCASVSMDVGDDLQVHDFSTRDELVEWLIEAGVPAKEIEDEQ